ncbi:glycosyltransferase [Methylobacterium sp. J-059]|uniref:glycosyltransferase n=1 Tax=Methylobacterium sp. J-059 TaxID=2836643 RepID=UPI001FBA931C|nr:glycosyltransferase [Methylobacterium sp. J-059]MCJ2039276.1 glycosyltransferase [Methylobacterium sp. J-059]
MFRNINRNAKKRVLNNELGPDFASKIEASGLFDADWYIQKYPEVKQFTAGAFKHFCQYGIFEHRNPGPNFDTARYLAAHQGNEKIRRAPFVHALLNLEAEPERPVWLSNDTETFIYLLEKSGLFDEKYYLAENRDVVRSKLDPLDHYVRYGAYECRDPSPKFENEFYKATYPVYLDEFNGAIDHYLRIGQRVGHKIKGRGEYQRWIDTFDDLEPSELKQIETYAEQFDFSRFTCIQVLDVTAYFHLDRILSAYASQIGAVSRLRLLRGMGISDSSWDACIARYSDHSIVELYEDAADVVRNLSDGDRILLCAGASILRPHSCVAVLSALASQEVTGVYADHDYLNEAGVRCAPVFKPAMSPEFLRGVPYAGPIVGIRVTSVNLPSLVETLSQEFNLERAWSDLLLACDERHIAHIPLLLAHVIIASPLNETQYYEPAHSEALPDPASLVPPLYFSTIPKVRIVIPTRDRADLLQECIDSIHRMTEYPSTAYEIVIVDNDSVENASVAYFASVAAEPSVHIISSPGSFNFSALCNAGAQGAQAEILIFLNNDMTVIRKDWIHQLVLHARRPDIGAVGARLLFPDDTVQHGGVVLGVQGVGAHRLIGFDEIEAQLIDATREMTVVTGACLAIRRSLFEELGGFDLTLKVAFNDVKLCLDAFRAGYRNIYVGKALLYHHESKSRGYDTSIERQNRNNREAIYVRERFAEFFQDDPSYNPNLSLQAVGKLGFPPRNVRPWRRGIGGRPRVMLLSCVHAFGHGVAMVVAEQAAFMCRLGWTVLIAGPKTDHDIDYPSCERIICSNSEAAATIAMTKGVDCILVHTPPFFTITLCLGLRPFIYFVDHGEPPPSLFPDADIRRKVDWEKRICAPLAKRVFTISQTIHDQQYRKDALIVRNGNSHLSIWSDDWNKRREQLRNKFGFAKRFVILNVSRFGEDERYYKGVDQYMELAREANFYWDCPTKPFLFVHAGRGKPEDVAYVEGAGISVFSNISNAEMAELYAAADIFVSLSKWEGYNLGIGQARAMGLPVLASDIEAHREFGIETSNDVPVLLKLLNRYHRRWLEGDLTRCAEVEPWDTPLRLIKEVIEADLEQAGPAPWFRIVRAAS